MTYDKIQGYALVNTVMNLVVHKRRRIPWPSEQPSVSPAHLCECTWIWCIRGIHPLFGILKISTEINVIFISVVLTAITESVHNFSLHGSMPQWQLQLMMAVIHCWPSVAPQ